MLLAQLYSNAILASTLQPTYNVIDFSTSNKREHQAIKAITQDAHGFIWFASNAGLLRFDGLNIKKYSLQQSNDAPAIQVKSLLFDAYSKLWVGTNIGLLKYDEKNEIFLPVKLTVEADSFAILKLLEDQQKNIWVGTRNNGLFRIRSSLNSDNNISHFHKNATDHLKISSNQIRSLYLDNDNLWIGTKNGLSSYSYTLQRTTHHNMDMPSNIDNKISIYSILKLKNSLLLGSDIGLISFNYTTSVGNYYSTNKLLKSPVFTVKHTQNKKLIIGSKINGMMIIDPKTKKIMNFNTSQNQSSELNSNMVHSSFTDKSGDIWLGTNLGFNKLTHNTNSIQLFRHENNNPDCIASNENHALYLDSQKNIWLGAKGKGLNFIDGSSGKCKLFNDENINLDKVSLNLIMDIKEDLKGNIWIASFNEGLIKYDPKTAEFSQLHFDEIEKTQIIQHGKAMDIVVDKSNNLWLGITDHGLVKYDQKQHTLELVGKNIAKKLKLQKLSVKSIEQIDDTLWLGTTFAGLISFTLSTGQIKSYLTDKKNLRIVTMAQDKEQNIWLGTNDLGVIKFSPKTGAHKQYQAKNGLANNDVFDIQIDNKNNLWIGTYNGLSMFNQSTELFTNYYEKDGLQSNDSSLGSYFDTKTGDLWLGGMNGINRINTTLVSKKDDKSSLFLTSLKINGKKVAVSNEKKTSPLKENIISAQHIILTHKQNNFAFNFTNINYQNTDKLNYQYRLAGYDDWIDVARENLTANYTNIPSGEYQFQIRVTNNYGQWSGAEKSIAISVLPPWWLTTFALINYALFVIVSIYLVVHFRTRSLKNRAKELASSVNERTIELAKEKEKVEQLLEQKSEEFANLSHEFRTPLTLILGTSSQLLATDTEKNQLNRIEVIKRNGFRLLRMVDQLLNIETFRVKAMSQKSIQHTGIIISQLIDAFSDLALEKGIKLQTINIEDISCELVDDALEKIIVNLLSNAIKYTENGGSITLETKRTTNNELFIQIVDTGIGIPADQLDSVFDKYKRVLNKGSEQITGAGIGLALIKELIISHHGSISLTSKLVSGTCVTVLLPIINEVNNTKTNEPFIVNTKVDSIAAMELMSLTQQPASPPIKTYNDISKSENEKIKILIIEDNHDMNQYMANCLVNNYIVLSAFDGQEGVQLAMQEVPDLIISDVMMPKLDGYQAAQKIRENSITNHIPIILLTSRHDLESKIKGWHHQVDEYLTKPFNVDELLIRIDNLLTIRNLLKERHKQMIFQTSHVDDDILDKLSDTCALEQVNKHEAFIEKLNNILEKQYSDSTTSVNTIAKAMAMSERQFFRKLKSVLGTTPTEYLKRFRLEKACLLLAQGQSAINTAFDTGFSSQSYFGKCFKSEYGYPPSDFQKHLLARNKEKLSP